jgi:hypothetical protein
MELTDQTALVTGGTAGIGLACARLLAREGTSVIITGRDAQRGKCAAARIDGAVRFIQTDLSDVESVKSLVTQAGDVDILVNNASRGVPHPHLGRRVRRARSSGQQRRARPNQNGTRRGGMGGSQRRTRTCFAIGSHRRSRGDRPRGALSRFTSREFHHRLNPVRRWRRQCHLKSQPKNHNQERNHRCRGNMTPHGSQH